MSTVSIPAAEIISCQSVKLTMVGGGACQRPACVGLGLSCGGGGCVFMAWFQTPNTDSLCSNTNIEFNHVPAVALKFTGAIN